MPTPNLGLPTLAQGQAQKEIAHNDALLRLDALVQTSVKSRALATPPPLEPTRRVARPASKSRVDRSAEEPAAATPAAALTHDPLANPVVGWLAIVAGPGRGEILPLGYGVNDIGRGAGATRQGVHNSAHERSS